mgnify:CR=1 FL=1
MYLNKPAMNLAFRALISPYRTSNRALRALAPLSGRETIRVQERFLRYCRRKDMYTFFRWYCKLDSQTFEEVLPLHYAVPEAQRRFSLPAGLCAKIALEMLDEVVLR